MTALLQVRDLHVGYGRVEAVTGVHLSVQAGQIVSVIGANGAGKSTLMAALVGALPSRGVIEYAGRNLGRVPLEERVAAGMTLVPERRELFSSMTVEDNLRLGAYTQRAGLQSGLEDVFRRFPRLLERRRQLAGTLSGGEQQMLAIARALMSRPKLLLLDEPSLGLAPIIVREIFSIISELNSQGMTILLVEQNAKLAMNASHRTYVLEAGQMTFSGVSSELVNDERVLHAYLGG